jgi:hypothetical protein
MTLADTPSFSIKVALECPYSIITLNPKASKIKALRVWRYSFSPYPKQKGADLAVLKKLTLN